MTFAMKHYDDNKENSEAREVFISIIFRCSTFCGSQTIYNTWELLHPKYVYIHTVFFLLMTNVEDYYKNCLFSLQRPF
jgi:hypothetical protein